MRASLPGLLRRYLPGAGGGVRRPAEVLRGAADLVADGSPVALDPVPGDDPEAGLAALAHAAAATGLAGHCRVSVPLGRLTDDAAAALVERVLDAGLGADLAGPPARVRALAARAPGAGAVVPAAAEGAEEACRALAAGRVRLVGGRGRGADLAFVRCLNVLMAGGGHPGVGTGDRRLLAIAGERAAWNQREPETWEYVMTQGVQVQEQRRLRAGGHTVRVALAVDLAGYGVAGVRR
ncbi:MULTISPECIES: hypothetical protein [unclassified Blastococcus]